MTWMADVQKARFDERLPHQESRPVDHSELPSVKRLDRKVTRKGDIPFAGGVYCEVWVGFLDNGGGKADPEKAGLSLTTPILLTLPP